MRAAGSVAGVFPLKAGKNMIRLEHKNRFPYFEAFTLSAVRGRGGAAIRSSRWRGSMASIRAIWISGWRRCAARRARRIPCCCALFAYRAEEDAERATRWRDGPRAAIERFRGFEPEVAGGTRRPLPATLRRSGQGLGRAGSEANRRIERRNEEGGAQRRQAG